MGAFRRSLWFLDQWGRGFVLVALFGSAGAISTVVAAVVRAMTKLPLAWLIGLWVAVGFLILVVLGMTVARVLGVGLVVTQRADVCWVTPHALTGDPFLSGTILVANTDPDHDLRPVGIHLLSVKGASGKRKVDAEGTINRGGMSAPEVLSGKSATRLVTFELEPMPFEDMTAKVRITDQFTHGHRGTITFRVPPVFD